MVKDRSYI